MNYLGFLNRKQYFSSEVICTLFPGREADHSPTSSAEVKECVELYLHSPTRFHGVVL